MKKRATNKTKFINLTIFELAKKQRYPDVKLSNPTNTEILKKS